MIGVGGLAGTYGQMDSLSRCMVRESMGQRYGRFYRARHEESFASFAGVGGLARLKAYIESKLSLDALEEDDEMDLDSASNLTFALGTEMGTHLDKAAKALQYVNADRAVTLIW